ncbi:hypothetical protein [Nocardia sp. XZ_19_369]|uniref:hypothetical protein n=1 Tax=Nocardia sp. XZ_19_369 TaxID=2769487 RepID=UPI0018908135|nr:hypothetical protein [Nocardia sp. XZ_19_369]
MTVGVVAASIGGAVLAGPAAAAVDKAVVQCAEDSEDYKAFKKCIKDKAAESAAANGGSEAQGDSGNAGNQGQGQTGNAGNQASNQSGNGSNQAGSQSGNAGNQGTGATNQGQGGANGD